MMYWLYGLLKNAHSAYFGTYLSPSISCCNSATRVGQGLGAGLGLRVRVKTRARHCHLLT